MSGGGSGGRRASAARVSAGSHASVAADDEARTHASCSVGSNHTNWHEMQRSSRSVSTAPGTAMVGTVAIELPQMGQGRLRSAGGTLRASAHSRRTNAPGGVHRSDGR